MVRFEDLRIFVSAADHGSFSAAARELDLTPAVASAALKRLELTLETRLFVRSTRSLRLTADGERYLEYARSAIATLDAGRNALARDKTAISGTLSISVPSDLGRNVLLPWLDEFQRRHPASASRCASATGWPTCSASRWTSRCATARPPTPAWWRCPCPNPTAAWCARRRPIWRVTARRRRRRPAPPQLPVLRAGESLHDRWTFERDGVSQTVPVKGDRVSDDGELVRRWALAGCGVAYKSRYDVLEDLRAGRLVQLFSDHLGEPSPLYLLCVHRMLLSPAVKRLRACLQERFAAFEAG